MVRKTQALIYPEGDNIEIEHRLTINQFVDLNGNPLPLPLKTSRMIVYRVCKISTDTFVGEEITNYFLERIDRPELDEYVEF